MALKDFENLSKEKLNQIVNEASAVLARREQKERLTDWQDLSIEICHFIEKHGPIQVNLGPIAWSIDKDAVFRVPAWIQIPMKDED